MKRYAFGSITFLALAVALTAQEGSGKETEWYPLKKDTTWTYKVPGNSIVMKVTNPQDKDGAKVETLVNGKSIANEHIQVKDDGVYRTMINGLKPEQPVRFLKLPPKEGESWDVETKIQGQAVKGKFTTSKEKVTVPAGSYDAFKVEGKDFDIAGMKTNITYWFADKVGIVKLSFSLGGTDAVLELEKYEPGK